MSIYAENLLRELVLLGHEVTLVSQYREDEAGTRIYGGGPPPPDRVPAGVEVVPLPSHGETVVPADWESDVEKIVSTVVELHRQRPFQVLHAQYGYPPGLAVLAAARATDLPAVVSIQGGDGHWVGTCCSTHAEAMQAVVDSSSAVLIGSPSFRDEVVGNLGSDPDRFEIIPGATDTTRFTPADRPLGALHDPPVLLFHGRVDRRKGVLDLLEALPEDVRLIVSGIGPDLAEARARADGRTTFLGYVPPDEAPQVYRSADIFVSPTYSEGFSNTILEAMASGLPTVSTDSVGVVDCLRHGENGLLHTPGDIGGLRAALERLLSDSELRKRLATVALGEVRELYAWPVLASAIESVYHRVVGTTSPDMWAMPSHVDLSCRFRGAPHLL